MNREVITIKKFDLLDKNGKIIKRFNNKSEEQKKDDNQTYSFIKLAAYLVNLAFKKR